MGDAFQTKEQKESALSIYIRLDGIMASLHCRGGVWTAKEIGMSVGPSTHSSVWQSVLKKGQTGLTISFLNVDRRRQKT